MPTRYNPAPGPRSPGPPSSAGPAQPAGNNAHHDTNPGPQHRRARKQIPGQQRPFNPGNTRRPATFPALPPANLIMYQTGTDQIRKTTPAIVPGYVPPGTLQLLDHGRTPKPDSRHGHRAPIWSAGITITSYPAKYSGTTAAHPGQLNPPDFTSEIHANLALTTIATATAPTCQPP